MEFQREYQALMDRLFTIYDNLHENKGKPTRNNTKLENYKEQVNQVSREIDRLREKYREQYEIYDTIEGVQSTHRYILDDLTEIYKKPRPQNLIPNFGVSKPRRSSFSTFEGLRNRLKRFTQRRRKSFGGNHQRRTRRYQK
jgi:isoleucyl-tRNA synthetase